MRLPNLSSAVVRRSYAPAGRPGGRVGPLMEPPLLSCGDSCDSGNEGLCPANCPCLINLNGSGICKEIPQGPPSPPR